jgi:hypothetical protein
MDYLLKTNIGFLFISFAPRNPCYFLCLDTKKVTKVKSRLQIILGLLFLFLPTQYNSSSLVLLKQYCLHQAFAARLKTIAFSQNYLRPFKIHYSFYKFKMSRRFRCGGKTENGANCSMFGSANKAYRSRRPNRLQLSFSAPFLWFFDFIELVRLKPSSVLWTNKERTGKNK